MASVIERCSVSRSIEKSNVSPPTFPGRLQPRRERELPRLARVGPRQQSMLDLGRQRQAHRALPPREQVREAPVRDDDVRERVRGERDVGEGVLVRSVGEAKLDQADRLPAVGHGRVQANSAAVAARFHHDRPERRARDHAVSPQRHVLGGLTTLRTRGQFAPGVLEPDQRLTAEVGDQERDVVRADGLPEPIAKDIDRSHRRRILDRREQFAHVQPRRSYVRHRIPP